MTDWQRVPGAGAYARPENERRFLAAAIPDGVEDARQIEDRYLDGTRLRLRRVGSGPDAVHKLAQKVRVRDADPARLSLTNIYLDAAEYAVLAALPGASVHKTRGVGRAGALEVALDVFTGALTGLVLAEVEVEDPDAALALPSWFGDEVTHDDRFSGGALARTSAEELDRLLGR